MWNLDVFSVREVFYPGQSACKGPKYRGFVRRAHSRTCIRLGVRMLLGTCKTANVHVSIENTHEIVALLCYGLLFHAFSASRLPQQQHLLPHQPTRLSRLGPNWSESNRVFGFRVARVSPLRFSLGSSNEVSNGSPVLQASDLKHL